MSWTANLTTSEDGARALAEALGENPLLGDMAVDALETAPGAWRVTVYFPAEPDAAERDALAAATRVLPGDGDFAIAELPDEDWVAKSLAGLPPVRAGRFLVHGAHDRSRVRINDIGIEIEAGQAFGTGHHGTTAGCLAAIDALAKRRRIANALDIGTGSGVLAIAIARRFHVPVLASDIDPVAVRVAAENVRANGAVASVTAVVAAGVGRRVFAANGPFDLIVANILAGPLMALAPAVRRLAAPGGTVILSGLLPEQKARIVSAYRQQGLRLRRAGVRDGWLTLTFARPAPRRGRR